MEMYKIKLGEYRDYIEAEIEKAIPESDAVQKVLEAMRYSLLGGGKRIRGVLALACCEMLTGSYKTAAPAAVSVEMVHAYSLIHDDLPCMDDDELRRGKPSCHVVYGEARALLAGDALLTMAFEVLSGIGDGAKVKRCVSLLSRACGYQGMIRGQELDLAAEKEMSLSADDIEAMHAKKTGALISSAAVMGAVMGDGLPEEVDTVRAYAENIGLSFQIIDDILDEESSESILGKPVNSDRSKDKKTYLTVYGFDESRRMAKTLTEESIALIEARFSDKAWFLKQFAKDLLVRIN